MDYQLLFNIFSGSFFVIIGWLGNQVWEAVGKQRAELAFLREELPKTYITKDDFKDAVTELKSLLIAIDTKLDRKADK
jgi:hypothetical protein